MAFHHLPHQKSSGKEVRDAHTDRKLTQFNAPLAKSQASPFEFLAFLSPHLYIANNEDENTLDHSSFYTTSLFRAHSGIRGRNPTSTCEQNRAALYGESPLIYYEAFNLPAEETANSRVDITFRISHGFLFLSEMRNSQVVQNHQVQKNPT